ncbi:serine protease [Burkholderia multivorans]|uniref:S1 family peptidase n=3 Tax=Burkholderia multivorans TaxID=87883 RepID=UPI000D00C888|nr:serine protease [Burkholderia multivorans]AYY97090.1 serine protease [Burkholderia multivorans]PRG50756.1 hypothetical protein C6T63_17640 [Burkholderia multivorans]
MLRRIILVASFLATAFVHAQTPSESSATRVPDATDPIRRATVSIGKVIDAGKGPQFATMGSGVIVALDRHHGVIITAKHVVYEPTQGNVPDVVSIRVPRGTDVVANDLGVPVPLVVNGKNLWQSLPDGSDLAAIPLTPALAKYVGKAIQAIPLDIFAGPDDLYLGASIFVLGYPAILGEDYLTTPIARAGIVSWIDPTGPLDKRFLIDANVFNGNSGGPVFHFRSGFTRNGTLALDTGGVTFLGIVIGDAIEAAPVFDGQMNPALSMDPQSGRVTQLFAKVLNIGGIGVVEPASKVRQLVEQVLKTTGQ